MLGEINTKLTAANKQAIKLEDISGVEIVDLKANYTENSTNYSGAEIYDAAKATQMTGQTLGQVSFTVSGEKESKKATLDWQIFAEAAKAAE